MPAYNFQKQFVPLIESGEKRQTIRALRKDGRKPSVGETLYLYTGMRTKACRKLKEVTCKKAEQIVVEENSPIIVGIDFLDAVQEIDMAKADGFNLLADFMDFFRKTHGLPFHGVVISW